MKVILAKPHISIVSLRILSPPTPNINIMSNFLDGVELSTDRLLHLLNDRPKRPTLFKTSVLMLVILAAVAAIFVVIAHTVPGLNFVITCMAILLAFAGIGIFVLRVTGIIDNNTFQETLDSFLNAVHFLRGKDAEKTDNDDRKSPP